MAQIHMNIMADCFTNSIKLSRNTRNDFKMKDNRKQGRQKMFLRFNGIYGGGCGNHVAG